MTDFRRPTNDEREIIERLLRWNFAGAAALREQLKYAKVKSLDDDGCLEIRAEASSAADIHERVPTEGYFVDEDGVLARVLLHVIDGRLAELEVFKEDNSPVRRPAKPDDIELAEWLRDDAD